MKFKVKWDTSTRNIPAPTTTAKMDITTIYFCKEHQGCLLRDDTFKKGGKIRCRKHLCEVTDVTNSPVGHAYRLIVSPKPRV